MGGASAFNWPDTVAGGQPLAGADIGILTIRTRHPLLRGNVQHAGSFRYPVLYEIVDIEDPWALMRGDEALTAPILAGAQALLDRGAKAVVGACGSFAYYQKAVAGKLACPVFLSILMQVPFLQQSLGGGKLGIVCAAASSMNDRVFGACDILYPERLVIRQMVGRPEFDRMITGEHALRPALLCEEVVAVATELAREPAVRALLIQCSDLPPFAADIQRATGLPVFDMTGLIDWLHLGLNRLRFE